MNSQYLILPHSETNARAQNQDAFGHFETAYGDLFVLADGMGTGEGAHWAAAYAVENLPVFLGQLYQRGYAAEQALDSAFQMVNREIYNQSQLYAAQRKTAVVLGTTLLAALFTESGIRIAHLGDSRAYRIGTARIQRLTSDHSVVQQQVLEGMLTQSEARQHPQRHVLTRAVGIAAEVQVELSEPFRLQAREWMLLCSDGLWSGISDEDLLTFLTAHGDRPDLPAVLTQRAKVGGSKDNLTFFLIRDLEAAPAAAVIAAPVVPPSPPPLQAKVSANKQPPLKPSAFKQPGGVFSPSLASGSQVSRLVAGIGVLFISILFIFTVNNLLKMVSDDDDAFPANGETLAETADPGKALPPGERDDPDGFSFEAELCRQNVVSQGKSVAGAFAQGLSDTFMTSKSYSEQELAAEAFEMVESEYREQMYRNADWQLYVDEVGNALIPLMDAQDLNIQFCVIDHDEENAFAIPGGRIFIFRGLLERNIQNEAQLAFILAHEMIHIKRRHVSNLELIRRSYIPSMGNLADQVLGTFMQLPFSERLEQEADQYALQVIFSSQYSPFQAPIAIERLPKMEQEGGAGHPLQLMEALLATHPDQEFRACTLRNQIRDWWKNYGQDSELYLGVKGYQTKQVRSRLSQDPDSP